MLLSDIIRKVVIVADKMNDKIALTSRSTEQTYKAYIDRFGQDELTAEYESLCCLLADCPIMVD